MSFASKIGVPFLKRGTVSSCHHLPHLPGVLKPEKKGHKWTGALCNREAVHQSNQSLEYPGMVFRQAHFAGFCGTKLLKLLWTRLDLCGLCFWMFLCSAQETKARATTLTAQNNVRAVPVTLNGRTKAQREGLDVQRTALKKQLLCTQSFSVSQTQHQTLWLEKSPVLLLVGGEVACGVFVLPSR